MREPDAPFTDWSALLPPVARRKWNMTDICSIAPPDDERLKCYKGVYSNYGQNLINQQPVHDKTLGLAVLKNNKCRDMELK